MEDDFWPSIFCPGVPQNDESKVIYYFVLFTPEFEANHVWEQVKKLTEQKQLGYRSAVSPDPMTAGEHTGWFTIILHVAQSEKNKVYDTLSKNGLREYVIDWRCKTRFDEVSRSQTNFQASSSSYF